MKITISFLDNLENQIRANKAPKTEHLIKSMRPNGLPRSLTARFANLLRRMGALKYATKILNPLVRGKVSKPTTEEIIEYASCLTRLKLEDEAIILLNSIKSDPSPEIPFELGMAHVSKWDYPAAIKYFKKYLQCPNLNNYKFCVGELNLGACYIYVDELKLAESTLQKLLKNTQSSGFDLLSGNALELLGEISLIKRDLESANKYFQESGEKLLSSHPQYLLFLDQWRVITNIIKENGSESSLAEFAEIRKRATQLKNWNSLRELELFRAVITKDVQAISALYYGTPYPDFRSHILRLWGQPLNIHSYYDRRIGPESQNAKKIFDIASGTDLSSGAQLKSGQTVHRLLQALASDFYAPFLTTKVFSLVFKGSFFNPSTSPQQVYEVVKRLNEWFIKHKIPLVVLCGHGGYRLRAKEAYILRVPQNVGLRSRLDNFLENLKHHNLIENFSLLMVIEKLQLSERTASRLLSEGVNSGRLIRRGKSQRTSYFINEKFAA